MKESVFTSDVIRSLKRCGAWSYKIMDSPTSWTMHITRFTADKPCDILGMYAGRFFAIENKQIKKWTKFGLENMRASQIRELENITRLGGEAFVLLNVRIKARKAKGRAKAWKHENRLIVFDWITFKNKGTYSIDELKALGFIKQELKDRKPFYDLSMFLTLL